MRYIAMGGMGEVYEALDQVLGERIALKTVRAEIAAEARATQRFKREIQLARKVSHPNVCRIFDIGVHRAPQSGPSGSHEQVLFLTMELLEGETLSYRLRRQGRLAPAEALPLIRQMAAALGTAHAAGIVHRDFKTSNVVIVKDRAGSERVVVSDFGLARGASDTTSLGVSLTATNDLVGTPAYMAPEQVEGKRLGPAADIYALGVVIYEMTTGQRPFTADSAIAVALKRLSENPRPPREIVADLDPTWEAAILRCLARHPKNRFQDVSDVVKALEGEHVAPPRQWRWPAVAIAAFALALAMAAGYWLSRAKPSPSPTVGTETTPTAVRVRKSVAVLGFKNLGQPSAAWLSTALSEMLRTELAAGQKLRTIPGEAVTRSRLELELTETDSLAKDTLAQVRSNLGADLVVLGSYLALDGSRGARVRVDLRVQDAVSGELVTSAAEEAATAELFALVSKAGAELRAALGAGEVSAAEAAAIRASFPASPAAGQLYSEGLAKLRLFDARGARELLERAAAAEPMHPLVHTALANAWSLLGYDQKAKEASRRALDLSKGLSREDRFTVEGLHHETSGDWNKAVDIYQGLLLFFPDNMEYGLRLAAAQAAAGKGATALTTVDTLRKLPRPLSDDPRIDLAEAAAAQALTDFERQRMAAKRAGAKARASRARLLLAQALLFECRALADSNRLAESLSACGEARSIFASTNDLSGIARVESLVAVGYAKKGDREGARRGFAEALSASRKIGDQRGVARQLGNLANVERALGNRPEAKRLTEESLSVFRKIGDKSGTARVLNNLALVLFEMNDLDGARRFYEEALAAFREMGEMRNVTLALRNIGEVLHRQRKLDAARDRYEEALALSRKAKEQADVAKALVALSRVILDAGDLRAAEERVGEAVAAWREAADKKGEAAALLAQADLADRRGDTARGGVLRGQAARLEQDAAASSRK